MKYVFLLLLCAFVFLVTGTSKLSTKKLFPKDKLEKSKQCVRLPRREAIFGVLLVFAAVVVLVRFLPQRMDVLLLIGAVVSFLLGIIAALYRDKWPDQVIRLLSIAGLATPSFWLAVLLILVFSSFMHLLPASGALPNPLTNFGGYMGRMIMPAIALAVPLTGQMTRIVRTAMVEELDKDYVQTAKGSGLPQKVIIARNVLRNALITPVTTLGMKIGYLMGGAVVIEVIFNLPGMGMAILDGVAGNEPNLIMGVVIVVAFSFIIINIVVDMLYLLINPRIRSV